MLLCSIYSPNASGYIVCLNDMASSQIMNLCKDGKMLNIISYSYGISMLSLLLLLGLLTLVCKLSDAYIFCEGSFKNTGYPCIFNEIEPSAEEWKRQQYFPVFWAQIDCNRMVNYIYSLPWQINKIGNNLSNNKHKASRTQIFSCALAKDLYFSI